VGKKNYYPLRIPNVVPLGELCLPVEKELTQRVQEPKALPVRTYICCIRLSFRSHDQ
jgi:hypothetical protein